MSKLVWVQMDFSQEWKPGHPIRIFKSRLRTAGYDRRFILQMDYAEAVKSIRHQLFLRSKGFCELCGDIVLESGGHMHEQKHRGKGGEISLENSVFICPICHGLAHKDRNPHWIKKDLTFKDVSGKL